MTSRERLIALVPARGGSVGVPRKNLRLLGGVPLIAHTIRAALASRLLETVYVSSDDEEILSLAKAEGALPVSRPHELSTSSATANEVIQHFIGTLNEEHSEECIIVYLQPTSPFRRTEHIDEALDLLRRSGGRSLISVVPLEKTPFKSFIVDDEGRLQALFAEELSNANRQSLPQAYMPNGAIYAFFLGEFRLRGMIPNNGSVPYVMDELSSLDIDTEADLARAEETIERMKHGTV